MASAGRSTIIEVGGAGAATRARAPTTVQRGHIAGSLDCCSGALELSLDLGVPEFLRVAQVGRVGSVPLVQCHPRGRRLRYVQALVPRAAVVPKRRGSVLLCQCQQAPILFVLPWSVRLVDLVLDIPNHLLVAQHRRRGALLRLERLPCCRTDRRVAVVPRLRSPAELLRRGTFLLQEHVPRLLVLPQARRWELRRRGGHHVPAGSREAVARAQEEVNGGTVDKKRRGQCSLHLLLYLVDLGSNELRNSSARPAIVFERRGVTGHL